jgi:hypothetical protein
VVVRAVFVQLQEGVTLVTFGDHVQAGGVVEVLQGVPHALGEVRPSPGASTLECALSEFSIVPGAFIIVHELVPEIVLEPHSARRSHWSSVVHGCKPREVSMSGEAGKNPQGSSSKKSIGRFFGFGRR